MNSKQIIKTENKINKTIQKAKKYLDRLKKEEMIIREIKNDFFFDWLNY
jgi:hypothetical protein